MPRVPVPESQKKAQVAASKAKVVSAKKDAAAVEKNAANRKLYMKKAAAYKKAYKAEANTLKSLRATALKEGNFFSEPEAKVAFVVRIRGINDVAPKPRKILQLLRLRQIHTGVFVLLNKATINMLRRVESFIAWGYVLHSHSHASVCPHKPPHNIQLPVGEDGAQPDLQEGIPEREGQPHPGV